uniref:Uncharacterized protein n=1 Tax=Dicentrarchus labrax TaxID=13489 RepID=A0A8C4F5K3_DICLA
GWAVNNIDVIYKDEEGRILIIDISLNNNRKYRVINIYALSNENQRGRFFASLGKWMCNDVISVGDFNVVLTKTDVSVNNVYKNDCSRTKLIDIISDYNVIDIWRVFNPGVGGFRGDR